MLDLLALKNRTFGGKYRASEKIGLREKILAWRLVVGVQSYDSAEPNLGAFNAA
jgi:hypothetical protein